MKHKWKNILIDAFWVLLLTLMIAVLLKVFFNLMELLAFIMSMFIVIFLILM